MTTIVSCFLANTNGHRNTAKYIQLGQKLLDAKVPKIIFLDKDLLTRVSWNMNDTFIVPIDKSDVYLYEYDMPEFSIDTTNPVKDTREYMCLICSKTEFVRRAVDLNVFRTEQFVWVDFGINHIFRCPDETFKKYIQTLTLKKYNKVRIGSIWPLDGLFDETMYRHVLWYFAGGVFGGDGDSLVKFADVTKEWCLKLIQSKKIIFWETNMWYFVWLQNADLFSPYSCDHNETLLTNY